MKDWLTLGSIDLRIFVMDVEDFLLEFLPRDYGYRYCDAVIWKARICEAMPGFVGEE